eukprot:TRINITY_DN24305_c0_g1_i2.p1 TRINITY_DN24305_c0_g1~~TRINITY_DN24305_c0_g1_i2.p1  ORF type:complete len:730 (-),score=154.31 TRINITY_DN24305_c0_g1_i2:48-2237(-)
MAASASGSSAAPRSVVPPPPARVEPRSPEPSLASLAARLGTVRCAPFESGFVDNSPRLGPLRKRPRALPAVLDLPALADVPQRSADSGTRGEGHGSSSSSSATAATAAGWQPGQPPASASAAAVASDEAPMASTGTTAVTSDWRMVLYHDRNVIMYNPGETPPFRSRRIPAEDAPSNAELANTVGYCPLCRQQTDSRFACAAQAYFDLLHRLSKRGSDVSASADTSEEVDLINESDLYRILGVSRTAQLIDIKRAYRKRSLRYHPDKNQEDPDAKLKFQKIAEAFSVLSDESKRLKYDKSGDMDLDDFHLDQYMNMAYASGLKYQKANSEADGEDFDNEEERTEAIGDGNPFYAQRQDEVPISEVIASEGGREAEAAAAAALRHLPPGLLNTGYYARFFNETRPLGSGSFGSVFLCQHVLDDLELGDYAVKKVPVGDNKAWLRDMIREVKTFERLHHPNVVEYKHSWLELSRSSSFCPLVPFLFILIQYCNGGSLDELLWHDGDPARARSPLTAAQVWQLLLDILLGLQHLHRQGILHRDLKPTNILLQYPAGQPSSSDPTGRGDVTPRALLSDFGTAVPLGGSRAEWPSTGVASRGYTGTVEYTAPEVLKGEVAPGEFTEKSDMWSLGIALYAMCFSSLPWSHDDPRVLKDLIRRFAEGFDVTTDATVWLPPDVDGRLGQLHLVMAALLSFDADRRPTATDLLENATFRTQAIRHARRNFDQFELQSA